MLRLSAPPVHDGHWHRCEEGGGDGDGGDKMVSLPLAAAPHQLRRDTGHNSESLVITDHCPLWQLWHNKGRPIRIGAPVRWVRSSLLSFTPEFPWLLWLLWLLLRLRSLSGVSAPALAALSGIITSLRHKLSQQETTKVACHAPALLQAPAERNIYAQATFKSLKPKHLVRQGWRYVQMHQHQLFSLKISISSLG